MHLRSITLNTFYQIVGRVISGLCGLGVTLLLARYLGSYYFGEYTKIISFVLLFYPVLDFGLNPLYLREFKQKAEIKFPDFLGLRLSLAILLAITSSLLVVFFGSINQGFSPLVQWGVVAGALLFITQSISLTAQALFQKKLRFDLATLVVVFDGVVNLVLVWLLINYGFMETSGTMGGVVAWIMGGAIAGILSLLFLKKLEVATMPRVSWGMWQAFLRTSFPFGLTLLFNAIAFRIDTLMLTAFRGSAEIGEYGLAYRFFELFLMVPTFVMNSVYPLLLIEKFGSREFYKKIKLVSGGLVILGIVITTVAYFGAPFILFVKNDYEESVKLLQLLSLSLPLFFITSPLMWLFVLLKKEKQLIWVHGLGAIVNVVLNSLFIPNFGVTAAAIITGVTELVILINGGVVLFFSKKNYAKR